MSNTPLLLAYGSDDPFFKNVVTLLFNDNAANGTTTFFDQSITASSWSRTGTPAYTNTTAPTGMTTSVNFPGSGANAVSLNPFTAIAAFAFPGDYTVEYMIRFNGLAQVSGTFDFRANGSDTTKISADIESGTTAGIYLSTIKISGGLPSNLTWAHYALCRSGSSVKYFLNGTQTGATWTDSTSFGNSVLTLGNVVPGTNPLNGQMACFRITKGTARYTTTFTPPTLPLPNF